MQNIDLHQEGERMEVTHYVSVELTSHEQYVRLLAELQQETAYIMLVQIDGEDEQDPILAKALKCMHLVEKRHVGKWPGTIQKGRKVPQYLFQADRRFFKFLEGFPSFFFNRRDQWGCDLVEETDFGQNDIAFLDKSQKVLFYTTTHEGYAHACVEGR